jgi:hypothetical protein
LFCGAEDHQVEVRVEEMQVQLLVTGEVSQALAVHPLADGIEDFYFQRFG